MSTVPIQLDPNDPRNLAITPRLMQRPPEPAPLNPQLLQRPTPPTPNLGVSVPQQITAPRGTIAGDTNERGRLLSTGSGESQIYNKVTGSQFGQNHPVLGKILGGLGQGLATAGDIGLSAVAPSLAINLPGTAYHHNMLVNQANRQVGEDTKEGEEQAQTANLDAQPEIKQAQNDLNQQKLAEATRQHDQQLREHGFKADETGNIVPLTYDEMNPTQQAVHDLKGAQEEEAEAATALKKEQADPNSPAARMAQQRIDNARQTRSIALERLGLSEKTFNARYLGEDGGGQALPGAMITDDNRPVGSAFSANVRPTGTERNKADLANSAAQQISDMKAIIQRHPTLFGPGYGQSTEFKRWLGSQDPDAQRFVAARTIAGDHLAGTFGGRSEAALNALDKALGQFKDNPKAALAGLDQLSGANKSFQKAGTVKTAGSNAASGGAAEPSGKSVKLSDAMNLPINKGKSEADVIKDIEAHGHKVIR